MAKPGAPCVAHRKREVPLCQAEIAGRKLERRSNKISTAVEAEMQRWQHYAAFVEQAATMPLEETTAAIWRKVEAATQKEAGPI